jgi:hypothetical protein
MSGSFKSIIEIKARHKPNVRSLSGSALISDVHIQLFKRKVRFPGALGRAPGRLSIQELQVGDYVR